MTGRLSPGATGPEGGVAGKLTDMSGAGAFAAGAVRGGVTAVALAAVGGLDRLGGGGCDTVALAAVALAAAGGGGGEADCTVTHDMHPRIMIIQTCRNCKLKIQISHTTYSDIICSVRFACSFASLCKGSNLYKDSKYQNCICLVHMYIPINYMQRIFLSYFLTFLLLAQVKIHIYSCL